MRGKSVHCTSFCGMLIMKTENCFVVGSSSRLRMFQSGKGKRWEASSFRALVCQIEHGLEKPVRRGRAAKSESVL